MKKAFIICVLFLGAASFYLAWKNLQLVTENSRLQSKLTAAHAQVEQLQADLKRSRSALELSDANYLETHNQLRELQAVEAGVQEAALAEESESTYELPPLVIPSNVRETASLAGQLKNAAYEFGKKYPDGPPPTDSPEYYEYVKEFDILMAEFTPLMLGMGALGDTAQMDAPTRAVWFTEMYSSSLGLEPSQSIALEQVILAANQQIDEYHLRGHQKPELEEDRASWHDKRRELSTDTWSKMEPHISPEQQKIFKEMFGPDYLYEIKFGIATGGN